MLYRPCLSIFLLGALCCLSAACAGKPAEPPPDPYDRGLVLTSPVPLPEDHQAFAQLTAQAAEHWRDMAVDVAERVYKAYADRDDLLEYPLYVAVPNNRPFTVAFYNFLRAELVSRGLQVSHSREAGSILLEYAVQTVPFDPSRFARYSPDGERGPGSNHEVVVQARMFHRNRFIMHCASVRYINDADLDLYKDPQAHDPLAESLRNVRIIRK
ncbi:MAG: hypothetical protein FWG17_02320 [Desulfovibrionaceae bacterium]|nr:hypothetical protein [Desulfovibrionaceae bacterium]